MVAAAPSVLDFVEGAPWWVKTIVGVLALLAPYVLPKVWPDRKGRGAGEDEEEDDLLELRDLLLKQVRRTEKAEAAAEAAKAEATAAKAEAQQLQKIVDALIDRRAQTPPRGTPPPAP